MNKKLFIIGEDVNLLFALQAKFSVAGFQVSTSQAEALTVVLSSIKQEQPDYVFLDYLLHCLDVHELLMSIKSNDEIAHIPVLVLIDETHAHMKHRVINLGAEQVFYRQPLIVDDFVLKIERTIRNKDKMLARRMAK